jgi:hypothetical protein
MSLILDGSNGITFPNSSTQAVGFYGFKNRIINGGMVIDQRNAGASVTVGTTAVYSVDRWQALSGGVASKFSIQQNAGSVTLPVGFINYLGCTSLSAYSVNTGDTFNIRQSVEGLNIADLGWGTANAKTVTLSFQVYSSLTGTFGGSLKNSDASRTYPFSYTISSANTWTTISITIVGDTTGTWLTTNGIGISVNFSIGSGSTYSGTAGSWSSSNYNSATGATSVVGTNGATFYITGVQLEAGSTATSFDYRPYGTELALCQRYYEQSYDIGTVAGTNTTTGMTNFSIASDGSSNVGAMIVYKVQKRAAPTITAYTSGGTSGSWSYERSGVATTSTSVTVTFIGQYQCAPYSGVGASWVAARYYGQWTASAEL